MSITLEWRYFIEVYKNQYIEITENDSNNLAGPTAVFVMYDDDDDWACMITIHTIDIRLYETYSEFVKRKMKDFKNFLSKVGSI